MIARRHGDIAIGVGHGIVGRGQRAGKLIGRVQPGIIGIDGPAIALKAGAESMPWRRVSGTLA